MKEIDLLPGWYKKGRRKQINCWTQYIVLGAVFLIMLVWNFITTTSVSMAAAEVARLELELAKSEVVSREFASIKNEMAKFEEKASQVSRIAGRIDVPCILAELSFLVSDRIAMSKLEIKAEKFATSENVVPNNGKTIRAAQRRAGANEAIVAGDARFKVTVSGVASGAADVAVLICSLEDSPYFQQVIPSFSRNVKVRTKGRSSKPKDNYRVSEFEIACYLANYKQNDSYFASGRVRSISER